MLETTEDHTFVANKNFIMLMYNLKSAVYGEAHARAERLKNKLYGSTLNSNWAYGGKIRWNRTLILHIRSSLSTFDSLYFLL